MPRNMSFFLTTNQVRNKTKTVTRRLGWWFLKPGEIINACVKCQGLGKGGKIERICKIRIVDVREELLNTMASLDDYGEKEATLEGFPGLTGSEFVEMFCRNMKCEPYCIVNRIEFKYIEYPS